MTSAGRLFLEHARQVLMEVDGAVLAARRTIGGERDRLSVACTPSPAMPENRAPRLPKIVHGSPEPANRNETAGDRV